MTALVFKDGTNFHETVLVIWRQFSFFWRQFQVFGNNSWFGETVLIFFKTVLVSLKQFTVFGDSSRFLRQSLFEAILGLAASLLRWKECGKT